MSQYHPYNPQDPTPNQTFFDMLWDHKYTLVMYIVLISAVSFFGLYLLGGVPVELKLAEEPLAVQADNTTTVASTSLNATAVQPYEDVKYPLRVVIEKIGVDTAVSNPTSADSSILNKELLKGAVRYPGSGTLGKGNMFIFGHSTGIRVVNNQAYKAFNNLKNLEIGNIVHVRTLTEQYNYKVTSVKLVDSNEALVTFSEDRNMLTLSTCDVFGQKQDRYVVEATFVKSISLE